MIARAATINDFFREKEIVIGGSVSFGRIAVWSVSGICARVGASPGAAVECKIAVAGSSIEAGP